MSKQEEFAVFECGQLEQKDENVARDFLELEYLNKRRTSDRLGARSSKPVYWTSGGYGQGPSVSLLLGPIYVAVARNTTLGAFG